MSKDITTTTTPAAAPTPTPPSPAPSSPITVLELQVDTQSPGWQKTLTKVLKTIDGLSYDIDASRGRATISGKVDPNKILLVLGKAGKHAEILWVNHRNKQENVPGYMYGNTPMAYGNAGYQHYNDYPYPNPYGRMNYYMDDPHQAYLYPHHQDYYPPHGYPLPYSSYYEPPAMHFPQPPPPLRNIRLQSPCNMM